MKKSLDSNTIPYYKHIVSLILLTQEKCFSRQEYLDGFTILYYHIVSLNSSPSPNLSLNSVSLEQDQNPFLSLKCKVYGTRPGL